MTLTRRELMTQGALLASAFYGGVGSAGSTRPGSMTGDGIVLDTLSFDEGTVDPTRALAGGMSGVVFDIRASPRDDVHATAALDRWAKEFARPDTPFACILKAADFTKAKADRKFAIVLNCQDASILGTPIYTNSDENLERLASFYAKGLRVLQLTYTNSNGLGTGYGDVTDSPLTRLGRAVVGKMNELGMVIDVSHCSEATTLDAIARSSRPIAITHAGCLSLYPDKRNKSDDVIRKLADKGGYFGVYNMTLWMTSATTSSVETIVDHIDHVVKIGGIDIAGFGSDHEVNGDGRSQPDQMAYMSNFFARSKGWPGGEKPVGHVTASDMNGPNRMQVLASALAKRGYRTDAIEKILGNNFVRLFSAVCG